MVSEKAIQTIHTVGAINIEAPLEYKNDPLTQAAYNKHVAVRAGRVAEQKMAIDTVEIRQDENLSEQQKDQTIEVQKAKTAQLGQAISEYTMDCEAVIAELSKDGRQITPNQELQMQVSAEQQVERAANDEQEQTLQTPELTR